MNPKTRHWIILFAMIATFGLQLYISPYFYILLIMLFGVMAFSLIKEREEERRGGEET